MLGLVCLLRPYPAQADGAPAAVEAEAILLRKSPGGASLQLYGTGAAGGPSISFVDATGKARMQMSVDANGRPVLLMRDKAGQIALGVGLENDEPTVAVRGAKGGALVKLPLPKE
jgi:hypothetical protein